MININYIPSQANSKYMNYKNKDNLGADMASIGTSSQAYQPPPFLPNIAGTPSL